VRLSIFRPAVLVAVAVVSAPPIWAQQPAQRPRPDREQRFQISMMEGSLERVIVEGARAFGRRMQSVVPEELMWAGGARVRGFRLDNYGVFFDVEVPALLRSVTASIQVLERSSDRRFEVMLAQLQKQIAALRDPQAKQAMSEVVRQLSEEAGPGGAHVRVLQKPTPEPNPNEAYTNEVKNRLVQAMLDYSNPLQIGPDERLTLAASDAEPPSRFMPSDPGEKMTIVLSIKGSDLAAFRQGKLSREDATKRVEISEF
jgi:hypothetical protein